LTYRSRLAGRDQPVLTVRRALVVELQALESPGGRPALALAPDILLQVAAEKRAAPIPFAVRDLLGQGPIGSTHDRAILRVVRMRAGEPGLVLMAQATCSLVAFASPPDSSWIAGICMRHRPPRDVLGAPG